MSDVTALETYAKNLRRLHELWTPHPGQIEPGKALFHDGAKRMFLCLGRRFGKSALMAYFAVRYALSHPGSAVYIIGPFLKQAREIFLHSGCLLNMCPRELCSINLTEGRVTFDNGSFVRVCGGDDVDALRGIRASLLLIDEYKDIKPDVLDVLTPALVDEDGALVIAGTPPDVPEHKFWETVREAQNSPDWRFFHGTSYSNPYLKKEVIDKERARYEARGDLDIFIREYLAEFVPGGKRAVFGMLTDAHVQPYDVLRTIIWRNLRQWTFYVTLDPGTASTFAATICAVNHYKSLLFVMDEVYITQQAETSIGRMWPVILKAMHGVYQPDARDENQWIVTCDEAATWARNELLDQFDVASFPTAKASNRKASGISLLKDLMLKNRFAISARCTATLKELRSYMLDAQGNYVKLNDHAIDTLRYTLAAAHFSVQESEYQVPVELPVDERKRAFTIQDDLLQAFGAGRDLYLGDYDDFN